MNDNLRVRDIVVALGVGFLIIVALWASTLFGWVMFGAIK